MTASIHTYIILIIVACQEAAANPLQFVFPSWPDGSRVDIKVPNGNKTYTESTGFTGLR